jgi:hypothetical protein
METPGVRPLYSHAGIVRIGRIDGQLLNLGQFLEIPVSLLSTTPFPASGNFPPEKSAPFCCKISGL